MAAETQTSTATESDGQNKWLAGAAGGFAGSILFGLILQFVVPAPMLEMAIPAMYGIEGPALAAGWAIHQFHGVVLGLAYVALAESTPLRETAGTIGGAIGLGVGYGVVTTLLLAVLVMPIWLSVVGFHSPPPFPNIAIPGTIISTIGHIVYAVPLALAYAMASE